MTHHWSACQVGFRSTHYCPGQMYTVEKRSTSMATRVPSIYRSVLHAPSIHRLLTKVQLVNLQTVGLSVVDGASQHAAEVQEVTIAHCCLNWLKQAINAFSRPYVYSSADFDVTSRFLTQHANPSLS